MSNDEFILSEWEKEKMDYLKEMARIKDAEEKGLERGFERGMADGIVRGIEQGIEKGIEKGIEQGIEKKQREIVANMHKDGISVDLISKYVGLSISEIEKLIQEI